MKPLYQLSGRELQQAAHGNAGLLFAMAHFVEHGLRGFTANVAAAIDLEQTAASMGHPRAMCKLGDRYARGDGLPENERIARTWWRNAANAGSVDAMSNLLDMRESQDPNEVAEGNHWLRIAAQHGQPHAVHVMSGGEAMAMADFANMSLEEMAAQRTQTSGPDEVEWHAYDVKGTVAQMNDAIGMWIERVLAVWPDLRVTADIDGEPADFPCPDPRVLPRSIVADHASIEVNLYGHIHHVQLDLGLYEDGWNINYSAFEPRPPAQGQQWIQNELANLMKHVGMRW